jgi:hypothetical protein
MENSATTSEYLVQPGELAAKLANERPADVVDHYIVASGEADLACRITHMPKALFA